MLNDYNMGMVRLKLSLNKFENLSEFKVQNILVGDINHISCHWISVDNTTQNISVRATNIPSTIN